MTSQRDDLDLLRAGLLAAFETADVAVKAQIAGQLRAVIKDLAALGDVQKEATPADDLAARRSVRRASPPASTKASRRRDPRRSNGSHRTG